MKETELNYSELVYLNAEKYVPEASFLQNKEELPGGKKVSIVKLGNLEAEAAFAYLYFNGHINLEFQTKKFLGIFPKKVVVATKKSDGANLTSLEKSIFSLSNGTDVTSILYCVIGEECSVPWAVVTRVVKESLVAKGFLTKEEITKKIIVSYTSYKYHLNPSKNSDFSGAVSEMNGKMKEFSGKDFYSHLVKSINSGINAQKEKPDNND
jgi:hypothetical protein